MRVPVFLSGMMGCGKSSVGRLLAQQLRVPFIDLDTRVERVFGASVAELFADSEATFRARERQALVHLLAEPGFAGRGSVVATGGGTVVDAENRNRIDSAGVRVLLDVSLPTLLTRLTRQQAQGRPLLVCSPDKPGEAREALRTRIEHLALERSAAYHDGAFVVDAEATVEVVAQRICSALDHVVETGETASSAL